MTNEKIPVTVKVCGSRACAEEQQRLLPRGTIARIVPRYLTYRGIRAQVWLLAHQVVPELVPELKPEPGRRVYPSKGFQQ